MLHTTGVALRIRSLDGPLGPWTPRSGLASSMLHTTGVALRIRSLDGPLGP